MIMEEDCMDMEVDLADLKGMKQEDMIINKTEYMAMEVTMEDLEVMITTKATSIKVAIMLIKAMKIIKATKAIQAVATKDTQVVATKDTQEAIKDIQVVTTKDTQEATKAIQVVTTKDTQVVATKDTQEATKAIQVVATQEATKAIQVVTTKDTQEAIKDMVKTGISGDLAMYNTVNGVLTLHGYYLFYIT